MFGLVVKLGDAAHAHWYSLQGQEVESEVDLAIFSGVGTTSFFKLWNTQNK